MDRRLSPPLLLAVALCTWGCRGKEALRQRCVAGELGACESSCGKGVPGEGGCFHAGQQYRAKAGLDFESPDFRRAEEYFRKSCDGRFGDGCLLLADLIEQPFGVLDGDGPGTSLPKPMPDASMRDRERRLEQGCGVGTITACKRLGDVLIGQDPTRSATAYDRACGKSAEPGGCTASRHHEVELAERWRASCAHGVADDCSRLGNLLFAVDVPRAVRLFRAEGQLRGVESVTGGPDGFVRLRVREASRGIVTDEAQTVPAPSGPLPAVSVLPPVITGQVAVVEVDRAISRLKEELGACAAVDVPKERALELALIVDRTGDVFRATVTRTELSPAATGCAEARLGALAFTPPPAGIARIELKLRFSPAGVPTTDKRP